MKNENKKQLIHVPHNRLTHIRSQYLQIHRNFNTPIICNIAQQFVWEIFRWPENRMKIRNHYDLQIQY